MKKVIVASLNPAKIQAVESAFSLAFPSQNFEFIGISVSSDVSAQPMTDKETLCGARNRVRNARKSTPGALFYVGLEAGFDNNATFAWMVIESQELRGESRSASLPLPLTVIKQLKRGHELGDVMDALCNTNNIKQKGGAISIFTDGVLTRSSVYTQALILALAPFHNSLFTKTDC
ncbi:inosine/xanthosine triphosphatase [Vibrio sp.]|nr:inosine/xanthosine triphosphatase [Vibrio sp.]